MKETYSYYEDCHREDMTIKQLMSHTDKLIRADIKRDLAPTQAVMILDSSTGNRFIRPLVERDPYKSNPSGAIRAGDMVLLAWEQL